MAAVVAIAAVSVVVVNGYHRLGRKLAAVKSEVAAIKEMAARGDFSPPLYGASHAALRKKFLLNQVKQAEDDFVLIIGDSIIEGLYLPRLSRFPVINAGTGQMGVHYAQDFLAHCPSNSRIKGILIAVGVNDAIRRREQESPSFYNEWEQGFREAVSRARELAGDKVAVSTIIPVEKQKILGDSYQILGDKYFDPEKISHLNMLIRRICKDMNVQLIGQDEAFSQLARSGVEYTTDSVHLNDVGYKVFRRNLESVRW